MITLRFLHDTPHDMFEGTYKLAVECYTKENILIIYDADLGHIVIRIFGLMTVEEVENDLSKYSYWFTAEESA